MKLSQTRLKMESDQIKQSQTGIAGEHHRLFSHVDGKVRQPIRQPVLLIIHYPSTCKEVQVQVHFVPGSCDQIAGD